MATPGDPMPRPGVVAAAGGIDRIEVDFLYESTPRNGRSIVGFREVRPILSASTGIVIGEG
jgi:hypothetical protein